MWGMKGFLLSLLADFLWPGAINKKGLPADPGLGLLCLSTCHPLQSPPVMPDVLPVALTGHLSQAASWVSAGNQLPKTSAALCGDKSSRGTDCFIRVRPASQQPVAECVRVSWLYSKGVLNFLWENIWMFQECIKKRYGGGNAVRRQIRHKLTFLQCSKLLYSKL